MKKILKNILNPIYKRAMKCKNEPVLSTAQKLKHL